jgi:hypothetical protein
MRRTAVNASNILRTPSDRSNRPRIREERDQASSRRSPRQSYEYYLLLAKDRALAGDPIEAERYYQYAEHYLRSRDRTAS